MTLMEQAHFKQVLSYKSGRLIGICNSCQAQWLYLKFIAGVDKRGGGGVTENYTDFNMAILPSGMAEDKVHRQH